MKTCHLYCFNEEKKLSYAIDITGLSAEKIKAIVDRETEYGKNGVASTCGRFVCAWCWKDLGPNEGLESGLLSYGICEDCKEKQLQELEEKYL